MNRPQHAEIGMSAYWDQMWESCVLEPDERDVWSIIDVRKASLLTPLIPTSGRALEVGCGSARLSAILAHVGYEMWCLDASRSALEVASSRFASNGLTATFVCGDACDLPFGDGAFDVVLSSGLLEHFRDPTPIVKEMARVLRPSGVFYSDIVPAKFSTLRALDLLKRSVPNDFFERSFNRDEIASLLRDAGLLDVEVIAGGVFPPRLPVVERYHAGRRFSAMFARVFSPISFRLDGTWLAERCGLYYISYGYRSGEPKKRQLNSVAK